MRQVAKSKVIELNDVSFSYGNVEVLKNISLSISEGDYFGIIGSNGAGKTTLLKIILGILKPSSGSVKIFGKDITSFKDWPRVGYLPQNVSRFEPGFPATVHEIVMMGRFGRLGIFRIPSSKDRAAVKNALMEVDMWGFKDRRISDLSGGQQQRVFIARALASEPEVIFLDEPTVGIDQNSRVEFYSLLRDLNMHHGITLILISHDVSTVLEESKHIGCIDRTLVFSGTPDDFMKSKETQTMLIKHLHLGHPNKHA